MPDTKSYRWCRIDHPERAFWGVPEKLPWPAEAVGNPDPKVRYPAGDMREGVRRLHSEGGAEWNDQWAALETFLDRGDELSELIESGEIDSALRILDELESLRPGTGYCPFNRAFLLRVRGDMPAARSAAITASERAPKIEWVWMCRGELHEQLKEEKDAIFCFRKALALLPNHQRALEGLVRNGAMCRLETILPDGTRRVSYHTQEDFHRKIAADIAQHPPDSPTLRLAIPQFLAGSKTTQADLALLAIDRILLGSPPDATAMRVVRADALRLLKRFEEAHEVLDQISKDDPAYASAIYVRAWCCFDEGLARQGWLHIEEALAADPNHEKAIMVKFGIGSQAKPGTIVRVTAWAEEHKSWRGFYCAALQCSTDKDPVGCLRWAEAAYRLAPHERDALFIYANSLNNAQEGEYTAALIHPQLPKLKGDFLLKFIFAGAMNKLGLKDEAVRVLREALDESGDGMKDEYRAMIQESHDELSGLLARGDIEVEFFPRTEVLRRDLWIATDEGPQSCFVCSGQPAPQQRDVMLNPPPGYTGSTGSLSFALHSESSAFDPVSLGWFRVHELDYAGGPQPAFTLRVTKTGKIEGLARQGDRRLPVTWSLYRVPSMETEKPSEP